MKPQDFLWDVSGKVLRGGVCLCQVSFLQTGTIHFGSVQKSPLQLGLFKHTHKKFTSSTGGWINTTDCFVVVLFVCLVLFFSQEQHSTFLLLQNRSNMKSHLGIFFQALLLIHSRFGWCLHLICCIFKVDGIKSHYFLSLSFKGHIHNLLIV